VDEPRTAGPVGVPKARTPPSLLVLPNRSLPDVKSQPLGTLEGFVAARWKSKTIIRATEGSNPRR
jgi:hypothetical protein